MEQQHEYVVGLGEVGTALTEFLNCSGRDIEWVRPTQTRILHIAYPWGPDFIESVHRNIYEHSARLTIVHSTVPVGTCDRHGWVHSPVTGKHPQLVKSLGTFNKFFGGPRAEEAAEFWPGPSTTTPLAANTEAGKLWELAQFGMQVRITQRIYEYCQYHGLDPELVYRGFAQSYNHGYSDLEEFQFIRPILEYVPGAIGGHCVQPGIDMLDAKMPIL